MTSTPSESPRGGDSDKITLYRGAKYPYYFIRGPIDLRIIKVLTTELSFETENFERTKAFQSGEWDGREVLIKRARNGMWYFPVGLVATVREVLDTYEVNYKVVDESGYTLPEVPFFTWRSDKELRDYQIRGIEAIKKSVETGGGGGLIALPTGSGKSLMIAKLIVEFQQPTLIVCHSKEIMWQWKRVLEENLGYTPAIMGDSKKEGFKSITVAMLQTLVRAIDNGNIDLSGFNMYVQDECFPYDTLVETEYGPMTIGKIVEEKIDCRVLTHTGQWKRVLKHYKIPQRNNLVKVIHEKGELICTPNHRILTQFGWIEANALNNSHTIYYTNGSPVRDMRKEVCDGGSFGGAQNTCAFEKRHTKDRHKGISKNFKKSSEGRLSRCHTEKIGCETRMERKNSDFSFTGAGNFRNADGGWMHSPRGISEIHKSGHTDSAFFKTVRVCSVEAFNIREFNFNENSHIHTEVGRIWGGNGNVNVYHSEITMLSSNIRNDIQQCGKEILFTGMVRCDNGSNCNCNMVYGRRGENAMPFKIQGISNITGNNFNGRDITNSKVDVGEMEHRNYLSSEQTKGSSFKYNQKKGISEIYRPDIRVYNSYNAIQTLYDLEVEDDHSYTANGISVHNCHVVPAKTAYKVAMHSSSHIRIGASATPHRQDGADMKMFAALGPIVCDVTAKELIKSGVLARPVFRFLRPESISVSSRDWQEVKLKGIVTNDSRNTMIVQQAAALVASGHKVYINVGVVEHGHILSAMLDRANVGNYFLHGSHSTKIRKQAVKNFENGLKPVMVSTLLKEGVDLPFLSAYINADGGKSEISQIQRVGRALRRKEGLNEAIIVDFIDTSHRFLAQHFQERYRIYCQYYGDCVQFPG